MHLVDYKSIEKAIDQERQAFIKVQAFSEDTEEVRSTKEAIKILNFLEIIQKSLFELYQEHPSLEELFDREFVNFKDFSALEYILELCFLDDFLFPDNEDYPLTSVVDGKFKEDYLGDYLDFFKSYVAKKKKNHEEFQKEIEEKLNKDLKTKELPCRCSECLNNYRFKLRDIVYQESVELIESYKKEILEKLDDPSSCEFSYRELQKTLDKSFFNLRFKLKRSTLNRLETQVKNRLKSEFSYPAEMAKKRISSLQMYFDQELLAQDLKLDIISELEYEKWYSMLSTNIWRSQKYLEVEFKKFLKSILTLKRKDISAKILKDYLGQFWAFSNARQIKRKIIYHMGPTNSGKTYHAIEGLSKVEKGCYLAPLRLLAAELYDTLNEKGCKTTLLTGEEVIETPGATHYSSTIEMARFQEIFDCVVIDEIQMIADPQRGWAWTRALVNVFAPEVHICGDPSVLDLVKNIVELCGDELEIKNYERMTDLEVMKNPVRLGDLEKSDALIVFSRKNALKYKAELERVGFKVSIVYGRLSPEVRREQARKFDSGETDIIVATDAIAMGMNLPIKRIIFSTITKHINSKSFDISKSEIKQIAGRAGRYQKFPLGETGCLSKVEDGLDKIRSALDGKLPQKKQCMVGPDLDIFAQVNNALTENSLPLLGLSEFLRLFNTMTFKKPFFCVELKEMIELTELVEEANRESTLNDAEIFGFSCAPVNLGLIEHVQYYIYILNNYARQTDIINEPIDEGSDDIDYLETAIKCVELYQWLARHFNKKNFTFNEQELLFNKSQAVEKLNNLLGQKIVKRCASCGCKLDDKSKFAICEECFQNRRFARGRRGPGAGYGKPRGERRQSDFSASKSKGEGRGKSRKKRKGNSKGFKRP
jgi:ATP-dependent RNA helicase SUPV3L1/SUV3